MNDLILKIEETIDAFYQQKDYEGYEKLGDVLEGLVVLNNSLLSEKLLIAMQALESRDTVLLADILSYEIKPILQ